ncbi:MAG: DUF1549 domain-containing protein [Planctomycetes bacterium]|nr:DUF1549 domain-containing protein [Planctomycetota bacterium]
MRTRSPVPGVATLLLAVTLAPVAPSQSAEERALRQAAERIDAAVEQDLRAHDLTPNPTVDDATFVRRTWLRIGGRAPTLAETRAFLDDRGPDKRTRLVDDLLASPAHQSRMVNFWADLLRAKTRLVRQTSGEPFLDFIRRSVADNVPYDSFVRAMLTAEGPAHARDNGATGYLMRDLGMPHDSMANTARVFLGTRIECAQCHDHPFDDAWTQRRFFELSAFQGGLRYTDIGLFETELGKRLLASARDLAGEYGDAGQRALRRFGQQLAVGISGSGAAAVALPDDYQYEDAKPGSFVTAQVPFGQLADVPEPHRLGRLELRRLPPLARRGAIPYADVDSRAAFARWLTSDDNPRFAAVIAARMFALAMGRGPLEPVDDLHDDTVFPNPALWSALEGTMRAVRYDLRQFERILYRTRLYQRTAAAPPEGGDEPFRFQGPAIQRLGAEQLWDSLLTLALDDPDATIAPPGARAEPVYARFEEIANLSDTELAARLEREVLRYADPEEYRRVVARERREQLAAQQELSRQQREALREQAAPLLKALRDARRRQDQREVARIAAELAALRQQAAGGPAGARRALARASELPSPAPDGHLLREFGQSDRETIEAANRDATVPQALRLLNGFVDEQLADPSTALSRALAACSRPEDVVETAFLCILQRSPAPDELRTWLPDLRADRAAALGDLVWTLVNSHEFRFIL